MTVSSQVSSVDYDGDGVTRAFEINFQFFDNADVQVSARAANGDAAVVATGFSVTGAGSPSRFCTFDTAPAAGSHIVIERVPQFLQQTDYVSNDRFPAEVNESDQDRQVMLSQYLYRLNQRSLRFPPGDANIGALAELATVSTRKGKYLGFDASGAPTYLAFLASGTLSQGTIGDYYEPQTPAELAAGVTPVKTYYREGDVRRYGAFLDGVIDDTTYLQNWANVGGKLEFSVAKTAKITGQIALVSNTTITAAKGATITTATADISLLYATGKSKITITGLHLAQTVTGTAAYIGHVALIDCTDCHIDRCTSDGYQWGAFYIDGGLRCHVTRNYITNANTTANDSADIILYRQSNYCFVTHNECFGTTGKTGIFVQDPYSLPQKTPFKNTIAHNKVGSHLAYGIVLYCPARSALGGMNSVNPGSITAAGSAYTDGQYNGVAVTAVTGTGSGATANVTVAGGVVTAFYCAGIGGNYADGDTVTVAAALIGGTGSGFVVTLAANSVCQPLNTHNEISHNLVQDIVGTYLAGASGMGLYVVGAGIGGTKLIGNTAKNCCVSSSGGALAQAAITVAGLPAFAGNAVVELLGNTVSEHTQYQGVYLSGMQAPVNLSAGGITLPTTNTTGAALRITNCSNVTVGGGLSVVNQGSGQGVLVQSLTVASSKISFGLVQVTSAAGTPFSVTRALGLAVPDFKLVGADISTTSSTPNGLALSGVTDGIISANKVAVGGQAVLNAQDCSRVIYTGNNFNRASGTNVVSFGGTGSGNIFDKTNRGVAANGAVVNGANAGVIIELNGSAAPGAGTWAVGDRVNQTVPVVGQPLGWRCTVSNAPGTWVAEVVL